MLHSLSFDELEPFIEVMYNQKFEDDLWEQYLSNPFREGSFSEFKEEALSQIKTKDNRPKEVVEEEARIAEENALKILDGMGGGKLGG